MNIQVFKKAALDQTDSQTTSRPHNQRLDDLGRYKFSHLMADLPFELRGVTSETEKLTTNASEITFLNELMAAESKIDAISRDLKLMDISTNKLNSTSAMSHSIQLPSQATHSTTACGEEKINTTVFRVLYTFLR